MEISVIEWCHVARGMLRGFVTIGLPGGLVINDVRVSYQNGKWSAEIQQPLEKDDNNKTKTRRSVSFRTEADRAAFSCAVIDALRLARPSIFA